MIYDPLEIVAANLQHLEQTAKENRKKIAFRQKILPPANKFPLVPTSDEGDFLQWHPGGRSHADLADFYGGE